ncbi:DHA2 family efflux MFS transporter permease subunit [Bradyrhizobium sp. AZCC 2289]|uniref:DHA2 family efflux MFS transporter permease subunit n=1 Tax=Bradyrhizobium sp. AZCC 2289 TaxID=3117026 RepID=UPI002FF00CF0
MAEGSQPSRKPGASGGEDRTTPPSLDVPDPTDQLDPAIWKIAAVSIIGSFLLHLNATIANVSLASLATEFNSSLTTMQWVTSGYLLAMTLVMPLNSWAVDRIGAKAVYLICFTAFTITSVLSGLAWSTASLIGFRVLQGMCAGLLAPMTQMMVARAAGKHLARVIGYIATPVLLAPLLGPVIAGLILEYASWRWLFWVNLPIALLGLILAVIVLPDDREHIRPRNLDWMGLALLSPGLALFLLGSDNSGDRAGLLTVGAAIIFLAAFYWSARRKGDRSLIDLRLFSIKVFLTSSITQFLSNGVLFAGQMLVPIYLIQVCGRSPSEMAWLMAPLGIGMVCTYPFIGALTERFGTRAASAGGAFLAFVGTLPLVYLAEYGLDIVVLSVALFVRGVGQSAVGVPSFSAAYTAVGKSQLPMATMTLNIAQRLGAPTFTTLCATFLGWALKTQPLHQAAPTPYASAFLLLSALHAAVFAFALRLPVR